jgi:hypothetical protein
MVVLMQISGIIMNEWSTCVYRYLKDEKEATDKHYMFVVYG